MTDLFGASSLGRSSSSVTALAASPALVFRQVCLAECEADDSPAPHLDLCRRLLLAQISSLSGAMQRRSEEEEVEALLPTEREEEEAVAEDGLLPVALQRLDEVSRALGGAAGGGHQLDVAFRSHKALAALQDQYQEEEAQREDVAAADVGLSVSKRFGGFVKGRHSYRKLVSPGRAYQKRYGGFIGIRKSARKWNNQKRFSEFLKQYLGMSTRATELDVSEDLAQQNRV